MVLTELIGQRRQRLQLWRAQLPVRRVSGGIAGAGVVVVDSVRIHHSAQVQEVGVGGGDANLAAVGRCEKMVAVGSQTLVHRIPAATVVEEGQCGKDQDGEKGKDDGDGDFGGLGFGGRVVGEDEGGDIGRKGGEGWFGRRGRWGRVVGEERGRICGSREFGLWGGERRLGRREGAEREGGLV